MATNYHCLLHYNTTIEKNDGTLPHCPLLFLLLLKHREEGDGSTFFVPTTPQKKTMGHCHCLLLINTKKKATTANCHCLFRLNTAREKGDGNKLPSPSSLQQNYKRRWRHIAIIFLFSTTPPQKKTTSHCRHLLLLKHKEDKTHNTKTKRREGAYLQAPAMPSHFWFLLLPFYFKRFLLTSFSSQTKNKIKYTKKTHIE